MVEQFMGKFRFHVKVLDKLYEWEGEGDDYGVGDLAICLRVKFLQPLEVSVLIFWGGVRLSPLGTSSIIWPIVPAPDDR
jgi:hypothetical protein